jgi:hypothetical protein
MMSAKGGPFGGVEAEALAGGFVVFDRAYALGGK